ncbi:MAG TPA: hypothetical protein PLC40_05155 [Candidatus Hydrogenedentes bacterium]|nr:hypothetical protein [Candidatus Hydrogenedentota bacterium]
MAVAGMLVVLICGGFDYSDRFVYPDGTEGAPAWYAESIAWEVYDGTLVHSKGDRTFALLEQAPHGREVLLEATLVVRERRGDGWVSAGVVVRQDGGNYWHLALIEAPEPQGKRHHIELTEMLEGTWLSESAAETRLTCAEQMGRDFDWQYGHSYRLRIHLRPERIGGYVEELDGTVRVRLAYLLDNRAVTYGQPALDAAWCDAVFDDVNVKVGQTVTPETADREPFPLYTIPGNVAVKGEASGFFHPEEVDGRWWMIDPNGQSFYMVGADHISFDVHWCEKLGYAPYAKNVREKYGSEANWADSTAARLADWHFNTLPANHSPLLRYRQFPHIGFVHFGTSFSDVDGLCPKTTWTGFPNVFHPHWPRHCEKLARQQCASVKDDPWLIGYFLDNELEWFGKSHRSWGLFEEAWKKPPVNSAKQAWIAFLKEEMDSVKDFEEDWGVAVADFDASAGHTSPAPPKTRRAEELALRWVRRVAEAYFRGCVEAIHQWDPNHLILGCRFAGNAPDIWDIAGKYCDVVSFNMYPWIDIERGVPESVVEQIRQWQHKAQRPMMITEWSFPALDAGLPSEHGAGMRVDTQEQRARCFAYFQTLMFSLPFMVGSNYFMWADEPALGISSTFPEDSNYGLVNVDDAPYPELTDAARRVNAQACDLHLQAEPKIVPDGETLSGLAAWLLELPPGPAAETGETANLQAGSLTLTGPEGGNAWVVSHNGTPLGRFRAMMHQESPESRWVPSDTAKITGLYQNEAVTVVEMRLDRVDTSQDQTVRRFQSAWHFWIPKHGHSWFASRCLWVENNDTVPWHLAEVFHYLSPEIGGDARDDEPMARRVPNYYRRGSAWIDQQAGSGIGCWYPSEARLSCDYWKGPAGDIHSDLRQQVNRELKPGDRVEIEDARTFFFPVEGLSLKDFGRAVEELHACVTAPL